jgi:hypothetical protein
MTEPYVGCLRHTRGREELREIWPLARPKRSLAFGFAGDGSPLGPLVEVLLGEGFLWGSELGDDAS